MNLPPHDHTIEPGEINRRGCPRCELMAQRQLAWMQEMERVEREVFPDARPRAEVVVEIEPHDGYRDPAWPAGFYWSETEGRPVFKEADA